MNMKLVAKQTTIRNPLTVGALLPNGATIVDFKFTEFDERDDGVYKYGYVLALRVDSPDHYVTWRFGIRPNQEIVTINGYYCSELSKAVKDLCER